MLTLMSLGTVVYNSCLLMVVGDLCNTYPGQNLTSAVTFALTTVVL
jgi:hypothetical protein